LNALRLISINSEVVAKVPKIGTVPAKKVGSTFPKEESHKLFSMVLLRKPFLYNQLPPTLLRSPTVASRTTKKLQETLTRELPSHSPESLTQEPGMSNSNAKHSMRASMRAAVQIGTSSKDLRTLELTVNANPLKQAAEQDLTPTATAIANKMNVTDTTKLTTQTTILKTESLNR